MKSIFDKSVREEIINRVNLLTGQNKPHWGKMTVAQMVKHCAICEDYYYGNVEVKRSLFGRLVGKTAIKSILKDEASGMQKNAPTAEHFKVTDVNLDFETERANWKRLIERYETFGKESFAHWFFGKMTKEQLGQFIYKHCDHHLRQFGV